MRNPFEVKDMLAIYQTNLAGCRLYLCMQSGLRVNDVNYVISRCAARNCFMTSLQQACLHRNCDVNWRTDGAKQCTYRGR